MVGLSHRSRFALSSERFSCLVVLIWGVEDEWVELFRVMIDTSRKAIKLLIKAHATGEKDRLRFRVEEDRECMVEKASWTGLVMGVIMYTCTVMQGGSRATDVANDDALNPSHNHSKPILIIFHHSF